MSFMNRLGNIRNPHQGTALKVLCVCSAGLLRSPTTAKVLWEEYGFNTRAVGCVEEYALIPIDDVLISWADEIVFMQEEHKQITGHKYDISGKNIHVLDIPDMYPYMDGELVQLIKDRWLEVAAS